MNKKISIMWMTRKRSHELVFSISSFIMNATDNANIEYIMALDPDDSETVEALEKILPMCQAYNANLVYCMTDKRYGYEELEQYQNLVGKLFTGECLLIMNDDIVCLNKAWDDEVRNTITPMSDKPHWIGISGLNEKWKGSTTFVGINRKWYDVVGRVSGNRATDGYLMDLGKSANIKPLQPKIEMIHLQRGLPFIEFVKDGVQHSIPGLPDDGAGGHKTDTPKMPKYYHTRDHGGYPMKGTNYNVGIQRFKEDLQKLLEAYKK